MRYCYFTKLAGWAGALLLPLLLAGPATQAQAPPWQTAATTPGTSITVRATVADANGNLLVAGNFANTATFGATTLTSTGTGNDGFLAKWSPSTSRFVWVQQISGLGSEYATALAVSGNRIYVGGVFSGRSAAIGNIFLSNTDFMGNNDLFVARFTDAGATSTLDWARQAGGQPSEDFTGLAVNGNSLYLVGTFSGRGTAFGTISLTNVSPTGGSNIFLAKMTDTGGAATFDWAQQAGGSRGGNTVGGVVASGGSVYLAGSYTGADVSFGPITLPPSSNLDCYVAKLADVGSSGSFTWVQAVGGSGRDVANTMAVNGASVYCGGYSDSPTLPIGGSTLSNSGSLDAFVAKLTDAGSSGSFVWGQAASGPGPEVINALGVQGSAVYLTGYSSSSTVAFGSTSLSTAGDGDVFLAKLTDAGSTGSFAWARQAGGPGFDSGTALAVQGNQIHVAGLFNSPSIAFNPTLTLARPGPGFALFLASLTDAPLTATSAARNALAFTLSPNPAQITTTLTLPGIAGVITANVTLLDVLGRTVRKVSIPLPTSGLRHELSVQGLPAGIYLLQVKSGQHSATRRLLVE